MRRRLWPALAFVLTACGVNDSTGPSADPVKGFWVYNHLTSGGGTACTETGSLEFVPAATRVTGTFNGRGGCENATIAFDYAKAGVVSGQVGSDTFEFSLTASLETCVYQGTLGAGTPDTLSGTVVCTPANGDPLRQGSWSMRR